MPTGRLGAPWSLSYRVSLESHAKRHEPHFARCRVLRIEPPSTVAFRGQLTIWFPAHFTASRSAGGPPIFERLDVATTRGSKIAIILTGRVWRHSQT